MKTIIVLTSNFFKTYCILIFFHHIVYISFSCISLYFSLKVKLEGKMKKAINSDIGAEGSEIIFEIIFEWPLKGTLSISLCSLRIPFSYAQLAEGS